MTANVLTTLAFIIAAVLGFLFCDVLDRWRKSKVSDQDKTFNIRLMVFGADGNSDTVYCNHINPGCGTLFYETRDGVFATNLKYTAHFQTCKEGDGRASFSS